MEDTGDYGVRKFLFFFLTTVAEAPIIHLNGSNLDEIEVFRVFLKSLRALKTPVRDGEKVMCEEWKEKGKLLQEVDALRSRIAQLEQSKSSTKGEEPKRAEDAFRSIFDRLAEGALLTNPKNGRCLTGNKRICEMLGCNVEQIANLHVTDIYPQEDQDRIKKQLQKLRHGESIVTKNVPIKRRDGCFILADISSVPLTFDDQICAMSLFRETLPQKVKSISQENTSTDSSESRHLTATEMRVLRLIVNGMNSKEIAHYLHRSIRTIQNHRANLMTKFGVDNSIALVKKAFEMKIIE